MITIQHGENGFYVKQVDDNPPHEQIAAQVCEEDVAVEYGDVIAAYKLLWVLVDMLGVYGSKHDSMRIRIHLENAEGEQLNVSEKTTIEKVKPEE